MSAHTPGPWNWNTMLSASENDKGFRVWANGQWIADVSPINDPDGNTTNGKANAKLIAAAPRLLAAAQNALAYMRLHKYADQAWADDLEAAIEEATS